MCFKVTVQYLFGVCLYRTMRQKTTWNFILLCAVWIEWHLLIQSLKFQRPASTSSRKVLQHRSGGNCPHNYLYTFTVTQPRVRWEMFASKHYFKFRYRLSSPSCNNSYLGALRRCGSHFTTLLSVTKIHLCIFIAPDDKKFHKGRRQDIPR